MPENQSLLRLERPLNPKTVSLLPITPGKEIERILERPP